MSIIDQTVQGAEHFENKYYCLVGLDNITFEKKHIRLTVLSSIMSIFNACGMAYVWNTKTFINKGRLVNTAIQSMNDYYEQHQHSEMENPSKSLYSRLFEPKLEFEIIFNILETKEIGQLCKFSTTNHELRIEQGKWQSIIQREKRISTLCVLHEIGDEFHYMMTCRKFASHRNLLILYKILKRPYDLQTKIDTYETFQIY